MAAARAHDDGRFGLVGRPRRTEARRTSLFMKRSHFRQPRFGLGSSSGRELDSDGRWSALNALLRHSSAARWWLNSGGDG